MNRYQFCVDEKPFCVFDHEFDRINKDYLESINPDYYRFISTHFEQILNDENSSEEIIQFAAISLRVNYGHALETLFALIFATLQAPNFIVGWMLRYRNIDLDKLVEKVKTKTPIKTKFYKIYNIDWESIIKLIFKNLSGNGNISKEKVIINFTRLLSNLAIDYSNINLKLEYNSIKHGFRAKPGGGAFKFKDSQKPDSEWNEFLKSDYGSFYYTFNNIGKSKNHFTLSHNKILWDPKDVYYGINFVGLLIHNIVAFLKGYNKIKTESIQFKFLVNEKDYTLPWDNIIGTGHFKFGSNIDVETVKFCSDEDIYSSYVKKET